MELNQDMEESVISAVKEFASSMNSGQKVVADMSTLINATSCLPLSNLDYLERLIRCEFSSALESTAQPKWKVWVKPSPFLTWIDLCSWDGYKREKTLRTLTEGAPNSFFFAITLRRLNDWVPEVRKAAREKLPLIANLSNPSHVADALGLALSNWNSWGRIEDSGREVLLDIISNKEIGKALRSKITSDASGPLTSIFSQIGRTPIFDKYLDEIADNAIQPSVRAKAYRSQFEGEMSWLEGRKWEWTDIRYCKGRMKPITSERKLTVNNPFLKTLKSASIDRSSIVRRIAAEFLIKRIELLGDESLTLANLFSKDTSKAVSERGVFALKMLKEKGIR